MAVSPMGEVIGSAKEKEAIVRVTFGAYSSAAVAWL